MIIKKGQRIVAADEDEFDAEMDMPEDDYLLEDDDAINDQLDDIADTVDNMQDTIDEIEEDDIDIELDNNIDGHYIAECDKCHGVFISAISESEQYIEKITGVCPLCDEETDQYLKWVVKSVE